jgi:hypothetical protein
MANRNFNRAQNLEKEVKTLFADVAIAASGAPTLTKGLGIASIVRDSAGEYTLTLDDKYTRLMHVSIIHLDADAQDLNWQLTAEDVSGAKTISFEGLTADAETDPADGSRLLIRVDLKNSSSGE